MKRTSVVNHMQITSIVDSSIYEIGDAYKANPRSKAIALQKEGQTFQGDLNFKDFPIFQRKPHLPPTLPNIKKQTIQHHPFIQVDQTDIIAVSMSSLVQAGNLNHISADSRIKHFRILLDEDDMNTT